MKKSLRIASILLVLVLVTSCFVGGTFAKYVTSGNAGDAARVAKWGIVIDVTGDTLFSKTYETGNETVVSSNDDDLVAPGTKNDTGVTFTITGKPEVDFNLDFVLTGNGTDDAIVDVVVPKGTYLDWTTANDDDDTFTLAEDYYPVVYILKNSEGDELVKGNLAAIEKYLEGSSATKKVEANTDVTTILGGDGTYTLTWAWAYGEYDSDAGNDKADTLLGNVIAGTDTSEYVSGISTAINFDLAISATQID